MQSSRNNQSKGGSFRDLAGLMGGSTRDGGSSSSHTAPSSRATSTQSDPRRTSLSSSNNNVTTNSRIVIVSLHLPLRVKRASPESEWTFEWDEDALVAQAKDGVPRPQFQEVMYVGSLPVDIDVEDQEVRKGHDLQLSHFCFAQHRHLLSLLMTPSAAPTACCTACMLLAVVPGCTVQVAIG